MPKKGTIIITPFPFTDLTGSKIRPALVISDRNTGDDFSVVFISSSSNIKRMIISDLKIKATAMNGLKRDSIIKCSKIATLDKKIILGGIGTLNESEIKQVDKRLRSIFGL